MKSKLKLFIIKELLFYIIVLSIGIIGGISILERTLFINLIIIFLALVIAISKYQYDKLLLRIFKNDNT